MTVTDGATSRADELYRIHLRHLDACPVCRKGAECGQSARLRRAVRAARLAADKGRPRWT
ncbi:hypothetical protein [Streptomyces alboflavus]|uniref:hypothetical protein n=1 Tax=Streptomyces alboflavus TaxID=67267 RepID=UPI0004C0C71D|nr:hypothetical protein [Streptomyces alboflavus]